MLTRAGFPTDIATARDAFLGAATRAGLRVNTIEGVEPGRAALDWVRLGAPGATNLLILGTGASGRASFAAAGAVTHLISGALQRALPASVQALVIHGVTLSGPLWPASSVGQGADKRPEARPLRAQARIDGQETWTSQLLEAADRRFRDYTRAVRAQAEPCAQGMGAWAGALHPAFTVEAARRILADLDPPPGRVVILDLRSGPGRFGSREVDAAAPAASRAAIRAHDWFGAVLPARGLPPPRAVGGLMELLPNAEVVPVVVAFGTRRGEDLMLGTGGATDPIPANPEWRRQMLDGAEELVRTAIQRLTDHTGAHAP